MKLCVAQFSSVAGDVETNIEHHLRFITAVAERNANVVIFPELSLTSYEPTLAEALAIHQEDQRLDVFQRVSSDKNLVIGVGAPTSSDSGIRISMILFQPASPRETYSKQLLHADELPYFIGGDRQVFLHFPPHTLAPAICYESLQPAHSESAAQLGATIYFASVAKSKIGVEKAMTCFPDVAKRFGMTVLMANSVGQCDNFLSAGGSAVWNNNGKLMGQLDESSEGLLLFDLDAQTVFKQTI